MAQLYVQRPAVGHFQRVHNSIPCKVHFQRPAINRQQLNSFSTCRPPAGLQGPAPRIRSQQPFQEKHVCHASNSASPDKDKALPADMSQWFYLGLLFVGWYGTNIWFNIYNKQLFSVFPFPLTTTNIQFFIGSCLSLVLWGTGLVKVPKLDAPTLKSVFPLALIHVLGNVLTNVSLGYVAVSFTHTVKAAEPFFSVIFSALFLGDVPPVPVLFTLIPIVGGVVLTSLSEATFNWPGFLSAIASNITFQSRNVLSKKLMIKKGSLDNINLFQIITIMSFFLMLPISIIAERAPILPSSLAARGLTGAVRNQTALRLLAAGLCFHSYQQLSYMILARVAPITHSIGNCVKRVVVIAASIIAFQNPVSYQSMAGTSIAMFGVFMYSQVKRNFSKKKGAAASGGSSE